MVREEVALPISNAGKVSGIVLIPAHAFAFCVLAHGAGAGMRHPFLEAIADGLSASGVATLRYQFPYIERGSKRPDPPPVAQAAVRAAVTAAGQFAPRLPLLAGGKSFGGRMTSQAQADEPLPKVVGLAFLGFPLHPAGKPSTARARHLSAITIPMLFLQGTHDALADRCLLAATLNPFPSARLQFCYDADHAFHVPARCGRTDRQVIDWLVDALVAWARNICR